MANIKINYAELTEVLDTTPFNQNVLLLGRHGIGKSEIMTSYYEDKGFEVVTLFLGQMSDAGDILGLPKEKELTVGDATTFVMDFLPPAWWQQEKPFCLMLDEVNRGRPELLQVIFDLCLNRRIGGRELPHGSMVIAAANFGDEYQLTDLDPALVSRFNVYELDPTADEWIRWASKHGVDQRIISFINTDNSQLDPTFNENADSMDKTPDRRAWVRVSEVLSGITGKPSIVQIKIIAGIVGTTATSLFKKHIDALVTVDPKMLLYTKDFNQLEPELIMMTMQDLMYLNKNLLSFVVSKEKAIKAKKGLQDIVCNNFVSFIEFMKTQEMNEPIADLIQGLESNGDAAAMLLSDSKVLALVTEFIEDIDVK